MSSFLAQRLEQEIQAAGLVATQFSTWKTRAATIERDTLLHKVLPQFPNHEARKRLVEAWLKDRVPASFRADITVQLEAEQTRVAEEPDPFPSWMRSRDHHRLVSILIRLGEIALRNDAIYLALEKLVEAFKKPNAAE